MLRAWVRGLVLLLLTGFSAGVVSPAADAPYHLVIRNGKVVDGNAASLAILQKLGFQIEGRFRQEVLLDGHYVDTLRLGLFRDEFHNARSKSSSASKPSTPAWAASRMNRSAPWRCIRL